MKKLLMVILTLAAVVFSESTEFGFVPVTVTTAGLAQSLSGDSTTQAPSVAAVKAEFALKEDTISTWTAFGDSITSNNYGEGSYVDSAKTLMPSGITVYNEGVAGATANDILITISNNLAGHIVTGEVNVVTLEAGINDFLQGDTVAQAWADYKACVDYILTYAPDVDLYCIPFGGYTTTTMTNLNALGREIVNYAKGHYGIIDESMWLVNPATGVTYTNYNVSGANAHLNQAGNDLLGSVVRRAITSKPDIQPVRSYAGFTEIVGNALKVPDDTRTFSGKQLNPLSYVSPENLFGIYSGALGITTNDYIYGTDVATNYNQVLTRVWDSEARGNVLQFTAGSTAQGMTFNDTALKTSSNYTVSCWYKQDSTSTSSFYPIWSGTHSATNTESWDLVLSSRQPVFLMSNTNSWGVSVNIGGALTREEWHYLSVSFGPNGTNVAVMVDNVVSNIPIQRAVYVAATRLTVGSVSTSSALNQPCAMDQIRIYKRALSTNEQAIIRDLDLRGYIGR